MECEECALGGQIRDAETVRPHPNNAMPIALCTSCAINFDHAEQRERARRESSGNYGK